jgi:hypothetical protein
VCICEAGPGREAAILRFDVMFVDLARTVGIGIGVASGGDDSRTVADSTERFVDLATTVRGGAGFVSKGYRSKTVADSTGLTSSEETTFEAGSFRAAKGFREAAGLLAAGFRDIRFERLRCLSSLATRKPGSFEHQLSYQ